MKKILGLILLVGLLFSQKLYNVSEAIFPTQVTIGNGVNNGILLIKDASESDEFKLTDDGTNASILSDNPLIIGGQGNTYNENLIFNFETVENALTITTGTGITLVTYAAIALSSNVITVNTSLLPDANDGASLGTTALQFSDLFMAEGAVLNWDNGDITLTQVNNVMTLAGATTWDYGTVSILDFNGAFTVTSNNGKQSFNSTAGQEFNTRIIPDASGGADIGSASLQWGDVYIADDKKIYLGSNQDFSMEYDEDGNDHAVFVGADINMSGKYFLNEQGRVDHVVNTMPAPYYRFDGANDVVTVSDNANLDFGNGNGSISLWVYMPDVSGNVRFANRYEDINNRVFFVYGQASGTLGFFMLDTGMTLHEASTSWTPIADTWYYLVYTFENGVSNALYINGVSQSLSIDVITGGTLNITADLKFGQYDGDYYEMFLKNYSQWNRKLSSTEVKELYSGASVSYKHQGASQTEQTSGTLTIGKVYRIKDWITNDDFTNVGGTNVDGNEFVATGTTPTTWTNSSVLVRIGAVAEYDGSSMTAGTWFNKSGNDLDGTVTSASLENKVAALEITDELVVAGIFNYAADAQGDDDYEIDIPGITALVEGLTVTFKANTANTDGVTLEITSVGDIDAILKLRDQALVTNDIEAAQIVTVVFDGTNWQMTSQLAQ